MMATKTKTKPPQAKALPIRFAKLHAKLIVAIIVGVAIALLAPIHLPASSRALAGWDIGVVVYLALTYVMMWRTDVESIRKRAAEQDEGAFAILLLSIVATIASLGAIVLELGGMKQGAPGEAGIHVLLAVSTILLSWAFVHTIFTFNYAHEYHGKHRDGAIGGLVFPHDSEPDYRDFLYFSLVIGMTSQTSDVNICSKVIRRMAAMHGVLSFFYNLTVLALTVNMLSNLI
jgi:uncharacterized membrane protein